MVMLHISIWQVRSLNALSLLRHDLTLFSYVCDMCWPDKPSSGIRAAQMMQITAVKDWAMVELECVSRG